MHKIQEYIVKDKEIFVGLEIAKKTWKLCVRSDKTTVHKTSMPADYENLNRYLKKKFPGCKISVMYEAGFSGFWLYDRLSQNGITCIVTPPNRVTVEKVNRIKTDTRDAYRLAVNLENGDFIACTVPDKELRNDRQLSRTLEQVQREITSKKNKIRKFLDFHGMNKNLPPGRWNKSHYAFLEGMNLGNEHLQFCLEMSLDRLKSLEQDKVKLKLRLKKLCDKARYRQSVQRKMSVYGIGWFTAIRLTLEWGDMSRFKSGKHIASFAGLTSSEFSTGETIRRGRITGQGRNSVRSWLIQCAWKAIKHDQILLNKFQTVRKNTGSKKKAIVAVARKITVRLRAIELSRHNYCVGVIE